MVAHHGHQNLFGKLKIGGLEAAEHHSRPLGQVGPLARPTAHLRANGRRQRLSVAASRAFLIRSRRAGTSARTKADSIRDRYSAGLRSFDRRIAMQNAVAVTQIAGTNSRELDGDDGFIQQAHEPAQRTDKTLRLLAPPVHRLRPGNCGNLFGQQPGEDLRRWAAGTGNRGGDIFAFGRCKRAQIRDLDPSLFGKGLRGGGRFSVAEGDFPSGPGKLLFPIGLARENSPHYDGEPPRRGIAEGLRLCFSQTLTHQQFARTAD